MLPPVVDPIVGRSELLVLLWFLPGFLAIFGWAHLLCSFRSLS